MFKETRHRLTLLVSIRALVDKIGALAISQGCSSLPQYNLFGGILWTRSWITSSTELRIKFLSDLFQSRTAFRRQFHQPRCPLCYSH
ncbi:hypothetical protein M433DRAFT_227243 [Acidomyces richmondensis BFW]|nr:MAG: hypothetical protein FE78DRAFT_495316 [Acidomyces sp. 'richmondensis']KYG45991.1 hypothetical protein M433DRAFT_227243 [Acidomyces richmondensis BFW]